jgi:hypothetical protein
MGTQIRLESYLNGHESKVKNHPLLSRINSKPKHMLAITKTMI